MAIQHMAAVFQDPAIPKPVHRLILLALADHADDYGQCYPSKATLAAKTGLTPKTIRQNLRELEDLGYLTTEAQAAPDSRIPGNRKPNLYTLHIPCGQPGDKPTQGGRETTPQVIPRGGAGRPSGGARDAPQNPNNPHVRKPTTHLRPQDPTATTQEAAAARAQRDQAHLADQLAIPRDPNTNRDGLTAARQSLEPNR